MTVWTAFFLVLTAIAVAAPFLGGRAARSREGRGQAEAELRSERVRQILWALDEVERDAAAGAIGEADRDEQRAELERELAAARGGEGERGGGGLPRG